MMSLKEIVALALGFIILLVGSFVGRDFSDPADVRDGFLMIVLFVGFFIVVTYLNTSIEEREPLARAYNLKSGKTAKEKPQ